MYPYPYEGFRYPSDPRESYRPWPVRTYPAANAAYSGWQPYYSASMPPAFPGWMPDEPMFRAEKAAPCLSQAEVELQRKMRLLWEQHITWTRLAIVSIVFGLPDANDTIARLLRNAPDMGNLLKPYYGDQAGDTYANLIKEHLVLAADLVKAAKAGDQKAVKAKEKAWYANADEIAKFLHSINPYLSEKDVKKMFYEHLALTKNEAVTMLNKDYKASIDTYDKIEQEALDMSDAITDGIVKQFAL